MGRVLLNIITITIFAAWSVMSATSGGRGTERFLVALAQSDSLTHARVEVVEVDDARQIMSSVGRVNQSGNIDGYRVRLFFDNSQSARQKAEEVVEKFKGHFPEVAVEMSYENPYFKVSAGNCLTEDEAIALCGRVRRHFARAFVTREEIPVTVFGGVAEEDVAEEILETGREALLPLTLDELPVPINTEE